MAMPACETAFVRMTTPCPSRTVHSDLGRSGREGGRGDRRGRVDHPTVPSGLPRPRITCDRRPRSSGRPTWSERLSRHAPKQAGRQVSKRPVPRIVGRDACARRDDLLGSVHSYHLLSRCPRLPPRCRAGRSTCPASTAGPVATGDLGVYAGACGVSPGLIPRPRRRPRFGRLGPAVGGWPRPSPRWGFYSGRSGEVISRRPSSDSNRGRPGMEVVTVTRRSTTDGTRSRTC